MTTRLLGPRVHLPDGPSFFSAYHAIFEKQVYAFTPDSDRPLIIDGGANVGLSAIYFKQNVPNCRVIAFEPDPEILAYCRRNLAAFGFDDVETHAEALWIEDGSLSFEPEGADGGRLVETAIAGKTITVRSRRLRDLVLALPGAIDLLKLDIEGAETRVLEDCRDVLDRIRRIFVEYHSFTDQPQRVARLTGLLDEAGFRIHAIPESWALQPFVARPNVAGMDMQLNVYAFRVG